MTGLKKENQPSVSRFDLSLEDYPKTVKEEENIRKPHVCYGTHTSTYLFHTGLVSRYQANPEPRHRQAVNHILKYLRRMRIICLCIPYKILLLLDILILTSKRVKIQ
ncbi:retrovirus-related pol polyprotein from transposon tnt 1-94 [Gossypium australe]|uniref:Retrovirus-related pol polyprotein from transposon tnt 1-94 n=1 Tax=Gossypium australe TaxID=47621 RepID=A0A5B6WPQ2_9ROSI|nr:retrovirus-related pol polyprotein from transposon tnt 1-94 [Gossypium australe]